jgi:hypothetical protein
MHPSSVSKKTYLHQGIFHRILEIPSYHVPDFWQRLNLLFPERLYSPRKLLNNSNGAQTPNFCALLSQHVRHQPQVPPRFLVGKAYLSIHETTYCDRKPSAMVQRRSKDLCPSDIASSSVQYSVAFH